MVMGLVPGDGKMVDHEDRDKLNNQKSNLRLSTKVGNGQNMRSRGGSSRYRGVSWDHRRQKWKAQATLYGKNYCMGRFDDELEAALAAEAWRLEHMAAALPGLT